MSPNRTVTFQETRLVRTLSVFVCFAFIFELVGLVGPGWIVVSADASIEISLHLGIWFAIVCIRDNCEVQSNYHSSLNDMTNHRLRYQLLTTAGTGLCLLSMLILVCSRKSSGACKFGTVAVLMALSGACSICASAMVGKDLIEIEKKFEDGSPYEFPWALLCTGVGGIVSALSILIGINYCCQVKKMNTRNPPITVNTPSAPQNETYFGGYNYNTGNAPPMSSYAPPMHNNSYGATDSSHLYPSLSPYGPNPSSDFVIRETPVKTPSAPPPPYEYT